MQIPTETITAGNQVNTIRPEKTVEKNCQKEIEREEQDLEKSINEYADLAMNEEMLENDDLLDEEEIEDFEENQNPEIGAEEEQIEAISQLSPMGSKCVHHAHAPVILKNSLPIQSKEKIKEANPKDQKERRDTAPVSSQGRKGGARSPDVKGTYASRKLAVRGRLSPKAKQLKPQREAPGQPRNALKVPCHEVYPSANKSRKTVSASGSMVSQKPSSTWI